MNEASNPLSPEPPRPSRSDAAPARPRPEPRSAYRHFFDIATRWLDNDVYGHVNNTVYFTWFDSAVNRYLIEAGALDIHRGPVIGFVVQSHCDYFAPLAYPQPIEAGLRIGRLGASSVRYEVAVFAAGHDFAAAAGYLTHVYVDRATQRPATLPAVLREALERLRTGEGRAR